eukprot:gene12163-15275_t
MPDPDEEDSDCLSILHSSDAEDGSSAGEMEPIVSAALLACRLSWDAGHEFALGVGPSLQEVLATRSLSPKGEDMRTTPAAVMSYVDAQREGLPHFSLEHLETNSSAGSCSNQAMAPSLDSAPQPHTDTQTQIQDQTQTPFLQAVLAPLFGFSDPQPRKITQDQTQTPVLQAVLASLFGFSDSGMEGRFCQHRCKKRCVPLTVCCAIRIISHSAEIFRGYLWDHQPWTTILLKCNVLLPLVAVMWSNQHYKTCSAGYLKAWHVVRMVVMETLAMTYIPTKHDMLLACATDLAGSVVKPILARDGVLINFMIALVQSMYFSMSPLAPPLQTVLLVFMVHTTCIVVRFCAEVKSRQGFLKLKKE